MKNKETLIDYGKNLLIGLLLVSAVILLFRAMQFEPDELFSGIGSFLGAQPAAGNADIAATELQSSAASPCYVLVTMADGSHYAAKYDGANKEKLTAQFSSYLGEALGSADSPVQVNEAEWRAALKQSGVFFDYVYPQPLGALSTWLGTSITGGAEKHIARRLFLGSHDDGMCLYYINESDYSIYRCSTALSFSTLVAKIAELPIGSASFAFELGEDYEALDPYFIFSDENAQLRAMTASNPVKDGFPVQELLGLLEMNSRTTRELKNSDGSAVYVDGEKSVSFDASGSLSFTVSKGAGIGIPRSGGELSLSDCIALVNSVVRRSLGSSCGEATLGLTEISNAGAPSACTIYFSYFIDGIPVRLSGGANAVRAQISSGTVVKLDMVFRSYQRTGEALIPMSEKQACAIAKLSGGEPLLRYCDAADGVSCQWIVN